MFDDIINRNNESKQQAVADEKEKNFAREHTTLSAELDNDNTFLHMKEERQDLTRWQQDLEDSISELKHSLMNQVQTDKGWQTETEIREHADGKYYQVPMRPMVNAIGTYKLISVVKRYLNRNFMMSNLDEETIYRILRRLRTDLVINLGSKYDAYEIDPHDLSIIVKMIMDSVEATLYRALKNGERNYLNTINKRVETYNEGGMSQPQKKGIIGGIFS